MAGFEMTLPIAPLVFGVVACLGVIQAPTFRTGVDKVRVDVLVTRDGLPVTSLTPDDFEVLDNGVPQRIDTYSESGGLPLSLVFAIDASSSVAGERAELLRRACHDVLDELEKDDLAGLVVFAESVVIRSRLSRDRDLVRAAVEQPLPPGQTSLVDAAQIGIVLGESEPGRALVLLLTDGFEVSSYLAPDAVRETARRSDAVIYGVTLRGVRRSGFVGELAEVTGGAVFEIASPLEIAPTFKKVLDEFRHRYLLAYTPTGVPAAGWHNLKVRVKRPGAVVKARHGYFRERQ